MLYNCHNRMEWCVLLNWIMSENVNFGDVISYILSALAVVFLTLPIHEFAHAFTATKLGDPTPRYQGRLTLNPFAHIDYFGASCIILFGFGWAKPVQVNQNNFRNPKCGMAFTALAGPVSNIIVALIALVACNGVALAYNDTAFSLLYYIYIFLFYIAKINVSLAVFNLIPIPPLDGSRILSAVLPYKYYYKLMQYERYIYFGLIAVLWLGWLDVPLAAASNGVISVLSFVASLPFKFL